MTGNVRRTRKVPRAPRRSGIHPALWIVPTLAVIAVVGLVVGYRVLRSTLGRGSEAAAQSRRADDGHGLVGFREDWGLDPAGPIEAIEFGPTGWMSVSRNAPQRLLLDRAIYDLTTGKLVAKVHPRTTGTMTISQDGRLIAIVRSSGSAMAVEIVAAETGKPMLAPKGSNRIPVGDLKLVQFLDDRHLLLVGRSKDCVVWNVLDGGDPLPIKAASGYEREAAAASPDGRFVAFSTRELIEVFDARTAEPVQAISSTSLPQGRRLSSIEALAFSHDGEELAVSFGDNQVIAWDRAGQQTFASKQTLRQGSYPPSLEALPDGSGWLLDGAYVLDRRRDMIIWELNTKYLSIPRGVLLDSDRVLTAVPDGKGAFLRVCRIPKAEIAASLAALEAGEAGVLRPSDPVAIRVELRNMVFGARGQTEQTIRETVTRRLTACGFAVADQSPVELAVSWQEAEGETYQVVTDVGESRIRPKIVRRARS